MTTASAKRRTNRVIQEPSSATIELICKASSMATLRTALNHGADWIRIEYRCNVHPNAGFGNSAIGEAIHHAHDKHRKVVLGIEASPHPALRAGLRDIIACAARFGIDAIELSNPPLMLYSSIRYPQLRLQYAAPDALSCDAIKLLQMQFNVTRIVLPKISSLTQVRQLSLGTNVELEVYGFGNDCALIERPKPVVRPPRTGNPATRATKSGDALDTQAFTHLNDASVMRCAGMENATNDASYTSGRLSASNALGLLPNLATMRVRAIRIEAPHDNQNEMAQITRIWREAIDSCHDERDQYAIKPSWLAGLDWVTKNTMH